MVYLTIIPNVGSDSDDSFHSTMIWNLASPRTLYPSCTEEGESPLRQYTQPLLPPLLRMQSPSPLDPKPHNSLATSSPSVAMTLDNPVRGSFLSQAHLVNLLNRSTNLLIKADTVVELWLTTCVWGPKALVNFSKVSLSTTVLNLRYTALCMDSNVHDICIYKPDYVIVTWSK
jgi:hypothetical protein